MKKISKQNSFKTPEGYFDSLTDRIMDRISQEDSVIPKTDGFGVPEGYFDSLNKEIIDQSGGAASAETKVVKLHNYRKFYFAAASVAAALLLVFGLQWNRPESLSFEDLAGADIESYFEDHEIGLSSYEMAELLPIEDLEVNDILDNELNEDNIIEYLDDNFDDLDELNIEIDE